MKEAAEINLEDVLNACNDSIEFFSSKATHANSKGTDDFVIHVAVAKGNRKFVEVLIDNGADINARGDMGFTPLHTAILHKNRDIIDLLLARGADISIRNEFGETPKQYALKSGLKI